MKKTVLIIHPSRFNPERFEKYELQNFINKNFEIIVHDLTELLYPKIELKFKSNKNDNYKSLNIKSYKLWKNELDKINSKYGFVLILNFTHQHISINNIKLYKVLSDNLDKSRYVNVFFSNPGVFNSYYELSFGFYSFSKRLKHIITQNLINITKGLIVKYAGLKSNVIVLGSKSDKNKFLFKKRKLIIEGHSWDFSNFNDNYNNDIRMSDTHVLLIDGAGPKFKNDDLYLNKNSAITSDKWYPNQNRLFDTIESVYKKKVIIKSHYSVRHEKNPRYFGYRNVFHSNLIDLICNSCFIISRYSTAISYGLLFNKPIILITSNEIKQNLNLRYEQQQKLANYLNCPLINIDDVKQFKKAENITSTEKEIKDKFLENFCTLGLGIESNSKLIIQKLDN